jgi:hypothetical protein
MNNYEKKNGIEDVIKKMYVESIKEIVEEDIKRDVEV